MYIGTYLLLFNNNYVTIQIKHIGIIHSRGEKVTLFFDLCHVNLNLGYPEQSVTFVPLFLCQTVVSTCGNYIYIYVYVHLNIAI